MKAQVILDAVAAMKALSASPIFTADPKDIGRLLFELDQARFALLYESGLGNVDIPVEKPATENDPA